MTPKITSRVDATSSAHMSAQNDRHRTLTTPKGASAPPFRKPSSTVVSDSKIAALRTNKNRSTADEWSFSGAGVSRFHHLCAAHASSGIRVSVSRRRWRRAFFREVAAADMMGAGKRGVAQSLTLTGLTVRGRKRDEALDAAGNMARKAAADGGAGHGCCASTHP